MKVAILGGGITGVSLAWFLQEKGVDYTLLEAAPRLGGLCRSEVIDGFTADCAGGHIVFSKHKPVLDFILGVLDDVGTHQSRRKSAIHYRGRYVQYPFENGLADLPKEDNFDCLSGYIAAHFARRGGAEEPTNFRDWCDWRFGAGISKHFMYPYNEKLWKIDLGDMSTRWVSGRIPDAPVEDVLRSSIGIRTEGYAHQAVFWYPLEGGFEQIVRSIAKRLESDRVHVGHPVTAVVRDGDGYLVNGTRYDKVISTIPLRELATVLGGQPDQVTSAFDRLAYTSLASVFVAVDAPSGTDRSWVYFPHEENGPFNRVTHLSNYSPRNAPEGKSSIMAEATYRGACPDLDQLQEDVVAGLARCGVIDRDKVLWTRVWTNKYAYILYTHDLEENLGVVRDWLTDNGIDILGRFGNYDYFNSDQCVKAVMDYVAAWPTAG